MNKLLLVLTLAASPAWLPAQTNTGDGSAGPKKAAAADSEGQTEAQAPPLPEAVTKAVTTLTGENDSVAVAESPLNGLYEVIIGPYVVYVSADGNYLMRGEMIDLNNRRNLTAPVRNRARANVINDIDESGMIVFSAQRPKHVVTVFTDVDCGYCAKLHREIDDYLAAGITVRYVAFPRAGVPSDSYHKMVSVWCADDPHKSMGDAKARRPVPPKKCSNPVATHYKTGQLLGVRGTPTIVMDNGDVVPGYMPAKKLADAIAESKGGSS